MNEEILEKDETITLYRIEKKIPIFVRRGIRERRWMDETPEKYAYRCLPLTMANQYGYEVCCSRSFSILWNGGPNKEDIKIKSDWNRIGSVVNSIFGNGIITFHLNLLVRTPENINLYVTGIPNQPKLNMSPLSGIVETDWNPATFTMNWQILQPNVEVEFGEYEPFCFFFPIERNHIDKYQLVVKAIEENQTEEKNYREWAESRSSFIKNNDSAKNWQKDYFQGKYTDGAKCPVDHQTKIKLPEIKTEITDESN